MSVRHPFRVAIALSAGLHAMLLLVLAARPSDPGAPPPTPGARLTPFHVQVLSASPHPALLSAAAKAAGDAVRPRRALRAAPPVGVAVSPVAVDAPVAAAPQIPAAAPVASAAPVPAAAPAAAPAPGSGGVLALTSGAVATSGGTGLGAGVGGNGPRVGAGAGSGDGPGAQDAQDALVARLREAAKRCYPAGAARFRLRGAGRLAFCATLDGRATDVTLKASTGFAVLDSAATGCVLDRAEPLPVHSGCYELPVQFGER